VRCAIVQPSYVPWRGYFDLIRRVDVFVFYDDVQYDTNGWRNRNRIKTAAGVQWLTIPVHARGAQTYHRPIHSIQTVDDGWPRRHVQTLVRAYSRAPHFREHREWLEAMFASPPPLLADFTIQLTVEIATRLGMTTTRFLRSSTLDAAGAKTDRLLHVLRSVGASRYLSGPTAHAYLDERRLADAGIAVDWVAYDYPPYPQLHPPFDPHVSVLDLLFMTGPRAIDFIAGRD
jgi:hypothetical protein